MKCCYYYNGRIFLSRSLFPFLKERVIAAKMPAKNAKSLFVPSNQKTVPRCPQKIQWQSPKRVAQEVIEVGKLDSQVSLMK